jgi:hypothetical protein
VTARATRAFAAAACVLLAILAGPVNPAAHAQDDTPTSAPSSSDTPPPNPGLTLVSQDPWVPRGGELNMRLRVDASIARTTPDAAIVLRIHDRTTTRSSFDRAIDGELGGEVDALEFPLAELPRDRAGVVQIRFGLTGSDIAPRALVRQSGSYPVEVGLAGDDDTTAAFVTWLVVVDTDANPPIDEKLRVAWILHATAPPLEDPGGRPDARIIDQMQEGGRLDNVAAVLERMGALAYSLVLGPNTIEVWADLSTNTPGVATGLQQVRRGAQRPTTQLLPEPYAPIDGTILEAEGLGAHLPEQFLAGAVATTREVRERPDSGAVFVAPANSAAVDRVRQMLVEHVVVREGDLVPVSHQFTPSQTFDLATPAGKASAATTAPFIERLLDGRDAPALKAQRVLAALSEVAYETPAIARGVVLAPPANWNPDVAMMTTIGSALRNHPLIATTTLDDFFAQVQPEEDDGQILERQLLPVQPERSPMNAADYEAALADFTAYRDIVGRNDPTAVRGERALRIALSTEISSERAYAQLDVVHRLVDKLTSGITTSARRITLTAREGEMPISFQNTTREGRVRVRVQFESPKLSFPEGDEQVLTLPPGNTTVRFPVETRASGTFPMTITLTSEDGRLAFGPPTRVTVRSAVFGGYAVALTVGALAFLAFWWGNHFRRTRRAQRGEPPAPTTA